MPKTYSSHIIVKVLLRLGFSFVKQRGSHAKFRNTFHRIVIVPMNKKSIPYGTFRAILQQAQITEENFRNALK